MYIVVLIMVLGFDEFIHVVSNPILFFFCTILGIVFYVLYLLNLVKPVITALETMLQVALSGVRVWLTQQLNQHNISLNMPQPVSQEKKDN
jgi:hypothetical protein